MNDEGEQGPKYNAKTSNLNVQHCAATTKKITVDHLSEVLFHTRLMYR